MEAKKKDLKKLAKDDLIDIDPEIIDELMDEAVEKILDDLENLFVIGTAAGVGFVGYKMYQSKGRN